MKMLKAILKKWHRYKCWRDFSNLSAEWKTLITYIGNDPQSKIDRGEI